MKRICLRCGCAFTPAWNNALNKPSDHCNICKTRNVLDALKMKRKPKAIVGGDEGKNDKLTDDWP